MKPQTSATQKTGFPNIGKPAQRALTSAGYTNLKQLTKVTEVELAKLHGMGPNALGKLKQALAERGLSFRDAVDKQ